MMCTEQDGHDFLLLGTIVVLAAVIDLCYASGTL